MSPSTAGSPLGAGIILPAFGRNQDLQSVTGATAFQAVVFHFSYPQLHLAEIYVRHQELRRAADQLEDFLQHHPDWPNAARMRETIERWRQ